MTYHPVSYLRAIVVKKLPSEFMALNPVQAWGIYAHLQTNEKVLLLWDLKKQTLEYIVQEINKVLDSSEK